MPIVFVHGVNNRSGDGYEENVTTRDAFLKKIVGPALIPGAGDSLKIFNPYWGDLGVKFAWDMASLPTSQDKVETMGGSQRAQIRAVIAADEILEQSTSASDSLADIARRNLPSAVEFLFAAQLAGVTDAQEAENLVDAYLKAIDFARGASASETAWLSDPSMTPNSFADALGGSVTKVKGETFGSGVSWGKRLKEGLDRAAGAIPDAANGLLLGKSREGANAAATRFVGDAFVYLVQREKLGKESPIVSLVLDALEKADTVRKTSANDNRLVVMSHSFGGEIMYDILTKYRPDLQVDCWVTIGSQVGLFEEMKLFLSSDSALPGPKKKGAIRKDTLPPWPNIKHWLNVYDLNDIFSYRAEPIFGGVTDYHYNTGYTTLKAHGGYFTRPSFYERLRLRIEEVIKA